LGDLGIDRSTILKINRAWCGLHSNGLG
jgi:hypothetical protein